MQFEPIYSDLCYRKLQIMSMLLIDILKIKQNF